MYIPGAEYLYNQQMDLKSEPSSLCFSRGKTVEQIQHPDSQIIFLSVWPDFQGFIPSHQDIVSLF